MLYHTIDIIKELIVCIQVTCNDTEALVAVDNNSVVVSGLKPDRYYNSLAQLHNSDKSEICGRGEVIAFRTKGR